jgi:exodeoxyribonuclease VII small subunit
VTPARPASRLRASRIRSSASRPSSRLTLEESIARYEEGVKLSRRLTQRLEEAEKTIERLVANDDGTLATEPMDPEAEARENPGPGSKSSARATARTTSSPRPRSPSEPDELPF